jgi:hypothetical protein
MQVTEEVGEYGPACFSREIGPPTEFRLWRYAAKVALIDEAACKGHPWCQDCNNEYQTEMKLQERCKHPKVTFIPDRDGFLAGFDPDDFHIRQTAFKINPDTPQAEEAEEPKKNERYCPTCHYKMNVCWWKNRAGEKAYQYARCRYCKTNERIK